MSEEIVTGQCRVFTPGRFQEPALECRCFFDTEVGEREVVILGETTDPKGIRLNAQG
ncbi:hypothetical protein GCM10022256_31160 [Frondihabitans peucedani]|uniref:Uncharacterized protein n=1 Tax=Frondihabitans peucedani TaxID=598626 RepID=A0ABP8E5V3_9MICO